MNKERSMIMISHFWGESYFWGSKDRLERKTVSKVKTLQISNALRCNFTSTIENELQLLLERPSFFWKSHNRLDLDLALSNLAQPEGICSVRLSTSTSTCKTRFDPKHKVLNRGFMKVIKVKSFTIYCIFLSLAWWFRGPWRPFIILGVRWE